MRTITGSILLLTAQQAFAQAYQVEFPNAEFVQEILVPSSLVLAALGAGFLIWGLLSDKQPT